MTKSYDDASTDGSTPVPDGFHDGVGAGEARAEPKVVPPPPRKWFFALVLLLVVGLLGYGGYKHFLTYQAATETQRETASFSPEVATITAKADRDPVKLTLPGQTDPFDVATIYPRATGYIAERRVDIGSPVKKGDLLARIAAPDLDAQLAQAEGQLAQTEAAQNQAKAQLTQANANLGLASITSQRYQKLTTQGYETVQNNDNQSTQVQSQRANVDVATAGIKVADANQKAQQATVDRLKALVSYERVIAPFDGVVTTRNTDIGDLVNADNGSGAALFTIARQDVLRVTVHVPQVDAFSIRDGIEGEVTLPQLPDRTFTGKIARSSIALQNSARTLEVQLDVNNPDGALRPGAYVNVSFDIPRLKPNVVLPAEALIFNHNGLQVATVQDDEVHMQTIAIYRDFGKTVELSDGLKGGEQVIINPPTDIGEHSKVKVKPEQPQEQVRN